jgi:hypothetical protein
MTTSSRFAFAWFFAGSALIFAGCSKQPAPAPPAAETETVEEEVIEEVEVPAVESTPGDAATDAAPATGETAAPATGDATDTAEVTAAFASLSEPDRTAALAQKICPVSDEALGSMGTPLKVTVEGREVFLCCEGCKKAIEEDPNKYLAKLDAAK